MKKKTVINTARANKQRLIKEYILILVGGLIFACGQMIFIKPMHVPMGGISGLALVANYLWNLPVGALTIVCNIPLFFLGYKTMSREYFIKTIFGTITSSIFVDILEPIVPAYHGETLLAAMFGGIIMGLGFGIIFRMGGTSGGTDIIAKLVNKKRDMPIGTFNICIDAVVIAISAVVYRSVESALYAIIVSFLCSSVIDKIVYGVDIQKSAMIITSHPTEISTTIMTRLGRGVTALEGKGMYTGTDRTVLLCAVRRHETGTLKNILKQTDPGAFLLLSNLSEVFGQGFKNYDQ